MTAGGNKLRIIAALVTSALVAVTFAVLWAVLSFRTEEHRAETPEQRAARCGASPRGEIVLDKEVVGPLADSTALTDAGKIKPVFVDGSTVGLEIFAIRPESLYDRAGLCDGDVVTSVGGIKLDSPEATLDAYEQLRDQAVIAIELKRRGADHSYRVRVQ